MSDPANLLDPGRAAHASIRGYLYQAWLGVERWLDLQENEVLRCEGDEDLDRLLRDGSSGWSEQVKALTGDLNIRDHVVQETLRRFAVSHHRLRTADPPDRRRFVFTSTATRRRQTVGDGLDVDVLEVWEKAKTDQKVRGKVVKNLQRLLPFAKPGKDHQTRVAFWHQLKAALAWLKSDPGHWADLIESIDWRLGEPDLDEVRDKIDEALSRLRAVAPPHLRDRLLAEVLEASVAPKAQDRCRTREQLGALLDQAEAEVARWLATARGQGLVKRLEELDDLQGVLFEKPLELPRAPRPGELLTAAYEVVPFEETGRQEILEDLADWCADERRGLVFLIHGDGGLGKTRLLIEWCRRLAAQGWVTGFLEPTATQAEMARLLKGTPSRLVVIDYAESRLEAVRFLVGRLARAKSGPRVRLVLLARREGDWWQALRSDSATRHLLQTRAAHEGPLPEIEVSHRPAIFRAAVDAYRQYLEEALPRVLDLPDLARTAFGRPLYLHMAALAAAHGKPVQNEVEALHDTLEREESFWREEVQSAKVGEGARLELEEAFPAAVTALTLLGGLETEKKARELARRLLPDSGAAIAKHLARLVARLYSAPPGSGRHTGGLEPDLLGEELIWKVLKKDNAPFHVALEVADGAGHKQLLTVLTRIAQRPERMAEATAWIQEAFEAKLDGLAEPALEVAVAQGDPIGPLLARAIQKRASLKLATRIMNRCDENDLRPSVPLREVALAVTQLVYDQLCEEARENAADSNSEQAQGELARVAMNLGNRLSDLGRHKEALQTTQEAVNIWRQLAQQRPDAFRNHFAGSLNNLGNRLGVLGFREEALQATQEAVEIWRQLAPHRPSVFLPHLARSLSNLGRRLSALDRREEALQVTQEAVDIHRQLAQQRPDVFRPEFAMSLNNLSNDLSALGYREKALQATQETVDLYRQLFQQRPDAFRPDLAGSLTNLGTRLRDPGKALEAAQEAVMIWRQLAQQRPDAFQPNLAESLGNLSICFSAAGMPGEALESVKEGLQLIAPYFVLHPKAFENSIGKFVRAYRRSCEESGREPYLELLGPIEEALSSLQGRDELS